MEQVNFGRRQSLWAMLCIIATMNLTAGCGLGANQSLEISLAPKVPQAGVNIGGGTKIYVSVLDQRPEKILGYRGVRGTISASEDIAGVIQKSLEDGLTSMGFVTLAAPEPSAPKPEATVQYLMGPSKLNADITGRVFKAGSLLYEKPYYHSREYPASSIARSWFEENFNASLSDLMGQLLADLELLAKLKL